MIIKWWRRRQRTLDIELLWPSCKQQTKTRLDAEAVFRVHMEMDPAYGDLDECDKLKFLKELP